MSLYGALSEIGTTLGPAIAALLLLAVGPETLVIADGATFALSAVVLALLPFGARPEREAGDPEHGSLLREAREGLRAARRLPGVRTILVTTGAVLLFAGMLNVVELLFARNELDAGSSGFSVLVALAGLGIVIGSAMGSRGGSLGELRHRYLGGVLIIGIALAGLALTPYYALACGVFVAMGIGNGLVLVHGRLLVERVVPERLLGRVFGVKDAIMSAALAIAFLTAGALVSLVGTRVLLAIAGGGGILIWAFASASLRRQWPDADVPEEPPAQAGPRAGQETPLPATETRAVAAER
jgi:MFS family permease